jgi:putative tryptophan/tyrosine transport system substrate-binding protein
VRRRDLMLLLADGAAFLFWTVAHAQELGRIYRLGMLSDVPREDPTMVAAFDELRRSGFVEGQNLRVEGGFSIRDEEIAEVAARLVAAGVDVIWTGGYPRTRTAQQATRTIPIVTMADDMVLSGLVSSLSHPGGNTTGISLLATELDGKRQELLTELVPSARHIAALADPRVTMPEQLRALEDAARMRGIALSIYRVAKPEEILPAIDSAQATGALGLNVLAAPLLHANRQLILDRVAALKLPAIYQWPETAEAGGLAGYGPRFSELNRQRARQIIKIFRSVRPADIPVEQPDRFELVINLHTAKAIGLVVPSTLLDLADKVIE